MRKYIVLLVILTILQCQLSAQDRFFYGLQGEKIYLEEDPSSTIICFKSAKYTNIYIDSIIKNIDINAQYEFLSSKMVKFQNGILYDSIIKDLSKYRNEVSVSKVYYQNTDNIYWCNNKVVVILPSLNILHTLLSQLSIEYEDISSFNNDGVYVISLIGMEDRSIQVSNMLYETGMVLSAQPDFYFTAKLSNVHYGDQWGLYNVGQYSSVYSGIDINTTEAWDIASGNNVKVAVIDCGIDLTHPDLQNNLLLGYDATNGANGAINGACQYDNLNGHGTACAGIIAAENNNIGTIGVAYNSKIIPIRAGYVANLYNQGEVFVSSSTQMADAINKAWNDYEADVLSFSVVFNNINVVSLEINNALSNGRNGNGCIIAASAGNYFANDPTSINYPASDSRVIAVGAISPCGELKSFQSCDGETHWGSCSGSELSVVAPGVLIPTTDLQGNDGYNPTKPLHFNLGGSGSLNGNVISEYDDKDYTVWFAGTSAAAPHVSGIAALMLSVNQNLTSTQVQNIIEKTAQKIRTDLYTYANDLSIHPNGTWSDSLGYGLIDAHAAVMEAYFYDREIIGFDTINPCNLYNIYSVNSSTKPNNTTVQWSVTGNIELVSVNSPYVNIRPTGPGTGTLMVSYTHDGYTVTKEKIIIIDSPTVDYYYNYSTTGNMAFNNELYINGTFTINSGNVVTINCIGQCFPDSKIVIMPGGKLIIDNGKLINFCPDKMWNGIYVVGDSTQRQLATKQGTLEVKNGSLIKNAKNAIVTWDGNNYATSGGIVKCSNSIFLNNRQSIRIYDYTNHTSGGAETDNVSYAQNCTFVLNDDNLFSLNNVTFYEFVKISHVRGISFKGSSFRDGRATADSNTKGIYSNGAGFTASELCLYYNSNAPCDCVETATRTKFSRLGYGIYAVNDGTTYNFTADHAIFDTCYNAMYMSAINNGKITRSDFDMSTKSTFTNSSASGIYSDNCSGYTIEANTIGTAYTQSSGYMGRGIYVYNSGSDANTVYRNTMNNMWQGICTNGSNSGLQLQCNEFVDNFNSDISIFISIASSQGSSSKSAGNKFISGVKKINSPSTYITYYHSGANNSSNVYCPNNSSATIVRVPNITANDCASTICIPFPAYPPTPKSAPENDDITLYESLKQIYESRLTEYTAAGYDFLLENFDENDADIVAIARLKQDTLISLSRTMAEIANRNLNAILADSVLDRESLNGWYNRINTTTAKYSLTNSYFETGEYALARQELAAIPQHFALSADELAEYNNFCDYNALRESVHTSGRNYAQLTEEEIAELEAIADLNTGVSSAYANSVLCFFYGICREIDEAEINDTPMNNKNAVASVEENSERESLAVYVYPNPADEELNILISSLPEGITTIEFHDVTGRLVLSEEIKSANTSINISSLRQGVYMYRIVNGDNVIARDRIVKNK